jgi:hypothetical protein
VGETYRGVAVRLLAIAGWLFLWHLGYGYLPCYAALALLVPIVLFVLLGMLEVGLLRRRAFLNMYLRRDSLFFRLLRGGILLFLWQTLKAVVLGVLLVIGSISWSPETWLVLGADALLLPAAYLLALRATASHARPEFQGMLVRRILTPVNAFAALLVIVAVEFHTPHPDLRDRTLVEAVRERTEQVQTQCEGVGILARGAAAVETASWWLAETQFTRRELLSVAPAAWLAFLGASLTFLWAWSRLLLGTLVSPSWLNDLRKNQGREAATR